MKKYILKLLFFCPILLFSQFKIHNITVKGQVTDYQNKPLSYAKIDLVVNDKTIKTINTDKSGNYEFNLEKGKLYILKFHKLGYSSKKIEISTLNITEEDIKYGIFPLKFDISLFEYFPDIDVSILSSPVAKFVFEPEYGEFIFDEGYVNKINKEIAKILIKVNEKKKSIYDNYISEGNTLYIENKLEDAILKFKEALNIFPDEQLPKIRIKEITEKIKEHAEKDKQYAINVVKGDKNFEKQSYKVSKSYYQKALLYKPEENYPQTKILEIENILAGNYNLINKTEVDYSPDETELFSEISKVLNKPDEKTNEQVKQQEIEDIREQEQKQEILENNNFLPITLTQQTSSLSKDTLKTVNKQEEKFSKVDYLTFNNNKIYNNTDTLKDGKDIISKGIELYKLNNFDKSLEYFKQAYEFYSRKDMKKEQAYIAETIGEIYASMYRYNISSDWYKIASNLYKETANNKKYISTKIKFAEIKYSSGDMVNALSTYTEIIKELKDTSYELPTICNSIGVIHFELGNYSDALKYFNLSLKSSEKNKNIREKGMSLNNIGNVKYIEKNYSDAIVLYNQSIDLKQSIDNKTGIAVTLFNIGNVYKRQNNFSKAIDYYKYAEKYAIESSNTDVLYESYGALADAFTKVKDFEKAIYYYKLYSEKKHLIIRKQTTDQINETDFYYESLYGKTAEASSLLKELRKLRLLSYYEALNKEKEIQYLNNINRLNKQNLLIKEKQVKTQRILLYIVISAMMIVLISLSFILYQFLQKKKINKILEKQNNEINSQKQEIEKQRDLLVTQKAQIETIHKELTDSIRYASRIQNAMLKPFSKDISEILENFVFYKPLGDVSGDFYWFYKVSDTKIIICVADCTGHGVPGAFMSILGISLLNEIIHKEKIVQPDLIENILRDYLNYTLGYKTSKPTEFVSIRDGMDISICTIDIKNKELQYAGANLPVYITRKINDTIELIELKPDRMPIGFYEYMENFTLKTLTLQNGDFIYLFSDGFISQFGGDENKKYGYNRFKKLLKDNYGFDLNTQKQNIEKEFIDWRKNKQQIDDVTIVGIKI